MLEFLALAQECAPTVSPQTLAAIVNVESGYNPYAIGLVGGRLARQPANSDEAVATARALAAGGWNFSMGVAQVNRHNLPRYQITYEQAFDACTNLRIGSRILEECFVRASKRTTDPQMALRAAISCYYSGNFTRGFQPDVAGKPSYVQKVLASAGMPSRAIPVVPSIQTGNGSRPQAVKAAEPTTPAQLPRASGTQSVPPPSDNAPVLLQSSNSANSGGGNVHRAATKPAGSPAVPGAKDNDAGAEAVSPQKANPRSSAIVF